MENQKNIALIGLGYWGKNVLRNLYELGLLHTACDLDNATLEERKESYPQARYVNSYEDIFNNPDIKALALATPAETHYALVKRSLLAGKDVYVEKPLAMTFKEGEELVRLAKEHGRVLMVGHILQYHTAVIKLQEMISAGELGKIRYIYSNRLNIGKIRSEENVLWSFAPHDISMILLLIGKEPSKVIASGGDYINKGIDDIIITTMEFDDGVKGHIFVSWLNPFKEQKLVVVGSDAMAVFDDTQEDKLVVYPHKVELKEGGVPVAHKAERIAVDIDRSEPLKDELKHFADCIKERKEPKTDGAEALRVLRVLEMAEAAISGGRVADV